MTCYEFARWYYTPTPRIYLEDCYYKIILDMPEETVLYDLIKTGYEKLNYGSWL